MAAPRKPVRHVPGIAVKRFPGGVCRSRIGGFVGILNFFRRDLTPDRFASLAMRRMPKMGIFSDIVYNSRDFSLSFKDSRDCAMTFNLHNVFRDYQKAARGQQAGVLDKYILAFVAPADMSDRETALANLMPVIRDGATFEFARLMGRLADGEKAYKLAPSKPFFDRLLISLVVDSEHATTSVSQDKLDEWGLDFDAALKRAMDNLRDRTEPNFRVSPHGVLLSAWNDVFDASRLLLTDMLYRLPIQGDPVIAIPSRDHLLVTGGGNDKGIAELADIAVEVLETNTRPLGYRLFRLQDGQWSAFDGDLPASERFREARYRGTMSVYDDQKKLLDQIHEKENIDIFVASYRVFKNDKLGGFISSVQWTRDVDALLPRADYVWFYCTRVKEIVSVPWDIAVDVLGCLSREPHLLPERYRVGGFPSDEQMIRLKQCAESTWSVPDRSPA